MKIIYILLFNGIVNNNLGKTPIKMGFFDKLKNNFNVKCHISHIYSIDGNIFRNRNNQQYQEEYNKYNNIILHITKPTERFEWSWNYIKKIIVENFNSSFNKIKNTQFQGDIDLGKECLIYVENNQIITQISGGFGYNNKFNNEWSCHISWNNFFCMPLSKFKLLMGLGIKIIPLTYGHKKKSFIGGNILEDSKHHEIIEISLFIGVNKYLFKNKWIRFLLKFSWYFSKEEIIHFFSRFFLGHSIYGFYRKPSIIRPNNIGICINGNF